MNVLGPIVVIIQALLSLYMLILLIRVIFDFIQVFSRDFRPTGGVLLLANLTYGLTDPPLRAIRKALPMLRVGGLGIDLSFLVLYAVIMLVQYVLGVLV